MTTDQGDLLRSMVRDVLRDVLPGLVEESAAAKLAARAAAPAAEPAVAPADGREPVVLRTDADLDAFVQRIVALADNPVTRQRLTSGRMRFGLAQASAAPAAPASMSGASVRRLERGALTERVVRDAAAAGQTIVLARGVVLTPLARDRARALGVQITKES